MTNETSITEEKLRSLTPRALEPDFLERLAASADDTLVTLGHEDQHFENSLRTFAPRGLPDDFNLRLQALIGDTPFSVDEKIVLFNKTGPRKQTKPAKTFSIFGFGAAAAVALLGSIAAFMIPGPDSPEQIVSQTSQTSPPAIGSPLSPNVTPASRASFNRNRNLSATHDEGVIWQNPTQPHRVIRLTFTDEVSITNEHGETIQFQQPRFEYLIVPEKID